MSEIAPPKPITPDDVVRRGQCMACGFCTVAHGGATAGRMEFDEKRGHHVPRFAGPAPTEFLCPGATMDMPALAVITHGKLPTDPWLGTVVRTRAAYATNPEIRGRAASGGVIPALLTHLFETGQIDAAYCVEPGTKPDTAAGAIIRRAVDLGRTHGSVYHPVNFGARLADLFGSSERFAYVGLPCEIAALERLKSQRPDIAARHVMSIGLFCGGINTFPGVAYYLEGFGIKAAEVESIAYRVGNWPGKIRLRLRNRPDPVDVPRIRGNTRWKILRYVIAFQGYWMLPRCRLCPDQVSDFADIAVGDPHLPRFRNRGGAGFSAVLTRTARGEALMAAAIAAGRLAEEPMSREEIIDSQGYTLDNRRNVAAYLRVARWLGLTPPRLAVYPQFEHGQRLRHYVYATVDLVKIVLPRNRLFRWFYIPWQVFEYVFLTFAPRVIWERLTKLIRNR